MGCESSYQVKIPSNQILRKLQVRSYHSTSVRRELHDTQVIHPWFLTGFVDEGCFLIVIRNNKKSNIGWNVALNFQISLHNKDITLLEKIQKYLGVGFVSKQGTDVIRYRVHSIKDLSVLVSHLENYPLITQKFADYWIFKQVFYLRAPPQK